MVKFLIKQFYAPRWLSIIRYPARPRRIIVKYIYIIMFVTISIYLAICQRGTWVPFFQRADIVIHWISRNPADKTWGENLYIDIWIMKRTRVYLETSQCVAWPNV